MLSSANSSFSVIKSEQVKLSEIDMNNLNSANTSSTGSYCRKKLDFGDNPSENGSTTVAVKKTGKMKNTAIVTGTIQPSIHPPLSHQLGDYINKPSPYHHRSAAAAAGGYPKVPSNSKRNARERRRVRTINDYFSQLQKYLPHSTALKNHTTTNTTTTNNSTTTITSSSTGMPKKMSKVETLKAAIEYIEYLLKFAPPGAAVTIHHHLHHNHGQQQQAHHHIHSLPQTPISSPSSSSSSLLSSPTSSICSSSSSSVSNSSTLSSSSSSSSTKTIRTPSSTKNITFKASFTMSQQPPQPFDNETNNNNITATTTTSSSTVPISNMAATNTTTTYNGVAAAATYHSNYSSYSDYTTSPYHHQNSSSSNDYYYHNNHHHYDYDAYNTTATTATSSAPTTPGYQSAYGPAAATNNVYSSSTAAIEGGYVVPSTDSSSSSSATVYSSTTTSPYLVPAKQQCVDFKTELYLDNNSTEKWHLKQVNEHCDNEIYIRDNKVILSYGVDNDSKVISRTFTFDSPISDCNWFNFKTDSNISGVIRDCLCMFELNKIHVYFPNGSDFHIQLPFKLKNSWKLRNGLLIEKQVEYSSLQPLGYLRSNQPSQVFFTISNPLDEIKPILCRNNSSESKNLYLRENSKQVIVDIIESLNLVLVFSVLSNTHSLYRITDYLSEDSQLVNNLLNGTITQLDQIGDATTVAPGAAAAAAAAATAINTPLPRTISKKMTANQTPRLSVSPIISTHSFYNKLALNSPLAYQQQGQAQQGQHSATTSSSANQMAIGGSSKTLMPPHLMMSQQKSYSPLATLSRSPSCSSSPALMPSLLNSVAAARRAQLSSNYSALANSSRSYPIQPNPTMSGSNQYLTPLIEVNQYRTPQTGLMTTSRYQANNNMTTNNNANTPINRRNLNFTPSCQTILSTTLAGIPNATAMQLSNEPIYEQMQPEYAFELIWSESASSAESSMLPTTTSASYCEKASKFFYQVDFYAQRYVCYLLSQRAQLRCVKVEYTPETDELVIQSPVHVISARDAVYVEQRQLMVVLDSQGALFVYSGLNKLCKLHLSNIVWSSLSPSFGARTVASFAQQNIGSVGNREQPSPVATPVKPHKLLFSGDLSTVEARSSITSSSTKAPPRPPPQQQQQQEKPPQPQPQPQSQPSVFLQPQTEFKSLTDSTGSHFSVKLKDNRLVRVQLGEQSTCKLVQLCLDALKYTLGQDIYVELVQQWYIHRYSVSTSAEQSIKDELSLFLYLIANLCGSFDLSRLERDLPVLGTLNLAAAAASQSDSGADEESKRAKSTTSATAPSTADASVAPLVDDWSYLCQDELIAHLSEAEKNLKEFDYASLANAAVNKPEPQQTLEKMPEMNACLGEPTKILLNTSLRQKRSISSTLNTSSTGYSSGGSTLQASSSVSSSSSSSGGGILYPHMKQLLYTLHLVYEEAKLYRSLYQQISSLVQILYLLANELGLASYMSYYESEMPILIKLKAQKVFSTPSQPSSTSAASSSTFTTKSFSLNQLLNLEPPVLSRFLFDMMSLNRDSTINPFPTIPGVCKRTQRAIKIYAVCALCTNSQLSTYSYEDFTNQLFFRINFSNNIEQSISGDRFMFKPGIENLHENIFSLCLDMGLCTLNEIYDYPFHVLFPVLESINWSRDNPCFSWPSFAFELIGRNDLAILKAQSDMISASSMGQAWYGNNEGADQQQEAQTSEQSNVMNRRYQSSANYNYFQNQWLSMLTFGGKKKSSNRRGGGGTTTSSSTLTSAESGNNGESTADGGNDGLTLNTIHSLRKEDEDGMQHVSELETLKCRFGDDLRVKEIRTCLQTTRPIQIKLQQGPDVSDHDFLEEEEKFLSLVCLRTMALPVGRGIFTLHTVDPIPTEPVVIPDLNLKGKSLTKKTTIDLTRIEVPANMTYWPSFHNGVAAGLTISAQAKDLSNAWIKSHLAKNFELTNEQAGFLYGLGLSGHLANFSMLNIHDALARRHDLTNIAILLGLAASKIGSMDLSLTRLISMHIKSLMPPVEIELETPYNIQIAALLSLGLVYVRTSNKHLSYVLLKEIGRLPGNEVGDKDLHSFDREAYSLTAGLSLGLILLEQGKHSLTIMDPTFTDELYHYMVGGHKEQWRGDDGQANSATGAASASATANETGAGSSNFRHSSSTGAANATATNNTNSSYIREGESINTNVTCPGATLALGLIYFNTCDRLIGEWFAPPDSAFLLDSLRPDFLLLRTVARNLIAWRYVLPTQAWLIGQLSPLLKSVIRGEKVLADKFAHLIETPAPVPPPKPSTAAAAAAATQKMPPQSLKKTKLEVVSLSDDSDAASDLEHVNIPTERAGTAERPQQDADDDDDDDTELAESDLSDDTDAENNIIVSKRGRVKKKPIMTSKHPLGDLIRFDSMSSDSSSSDHDFEHLMSACLKQQPSVSLTTTTATNTKPSTSRQAGLVADIESVSSESNSCSSGSSNGNGGGENMVDSETKTEAFRHIIAGACMSIGLKFAGTCNAQAFETLLFWSHYFTDLSDTKLSTESCLCVCVVSLALVMAGSGDLDVLRLCRYLRSRVGGSYGAYVTYGSQMAVSMALGLLFMGGGKYSFKTDALSVALMLAAFYPQFPVESNDNRFHLQAFRHLYVLAAEPRLLLPRDVDTSEFCYVPIEIKLKATEHYPTFEYKQMAPCILPELNKIQELKILGPRYYPIIFKDSLHFTDLRNILLSELLVKQKNGYYSYSDDPKDEKAFNIRNFLNKMIIPHKITPNLLEQITNEENINAFAQMLNKSNENKLSGKTNRLLKIIYESVIQETFDFVGVMLLLDKEANSEPNAHFIQQMKLVDVFYKSLNQTSHIKSKYIVNMEFLHATMSHLEETLREKIKHKRELISVYLSGKYDIDIENLINYCVLTDIGRNELEKYSRSINLAELISDKSLNANSIAKLLKLFQLYRTYN